MHPLLLRQIKRLFGGDIPQNWRPLLEAISAYYGEIEQERNLLENALRVNSEELTAINDRLRISSAQELAKQRALLHEIIDAIPDPIFIKDTASVYQICNKAVEAIFGATEAEIIGKTDFDFVEAELAAQFRQRDRQVLAQGIPCINEEWVCYPDGRRACLETLKTPYVAPDGRRLGVIGIARDITDRKYAEAALRESEQRFRDVLEFAPIGTGVVTLEGRFLHVNQALCSLLGYGKALLEGMHAREVAHPEDCQAGLEQFKRLLGGEIASVQQELRLRCRDGRMVWANLSVVLQRAAAGEPRYFIAQVEDITARREMRERDHFMATVLDNILDGVITVDMNSRIGSFNAAAERIFGYAAAEVVGKEVGMLMPTPYRDQHVGHVQRYLDTGQKRNIGMSREQVGRRKDGSTFPMEISLSEIKDGGIRRFTGIVRDITERKCLEEKILHLAHHDALTNLPNRSLFHDRLCQALITARRDGVRVGLMLVDLDNFKPVNDNHGHQMGDLLLKEVAVRLQECLRDSDTAARLGGDEFVVLLPSIDRIEDGAVVAEKILHRLRYPFELEGESLCITASIGVAANGLPDCDEKRLVRMADIALYQAKARGRNNVVVFNSALGVGQDWSI